jgi:hypothetical protein
VQWGLPVTALYAAFARSVKIRPSSAADWGYSDEKGGGEGGRAFVPFSFLSILHFLSYFFLLLIHQPAERTSLLFPTT